MSPGWTVELLPQGAWAYKVLQALGPANCNKRNEMTDLQGPNLKQELENGCDAAAEKSQRWLPQVGKLSENRVL